MRTLYVISTINQFLPLTYPVKYQKLPVNANPVCNINNKSIFTIDLSSQIPEITS